LVFCVLTAMVRSALYSILMFPQKQLPEGIFGDDGVMV
jgi:hypothetical protein